MGNVGSIRNMLKRLGARASVPSSPAEIENAARLILPGVGAFDTGMQHLEESGFLQALHEHALVRGTPILGICLGMQLLMRGSEEGVRPGLGWIPGAVVRLPEDPAAQLKVPHMGWNSIVPRRSDTVLQGLDGARFYFVHSYYVVCDREDDVLAWTQHGVRFASVLQRGTIVGTQFHPEKSHTYGMRLLKNFLEMA